MTSGKAQQTDIKVRRLGDCVSVSVGMSGCLSVITNVAYLCVFDVPSVSLSVICVACDSTGLNRLSRSEAWRCDPAYGVPKSETAIYH